MNSGSEDRPIRVGIGLISRNGAYLIRRRPPLPGSPMPGLWEFPGGKCEPGESSEAATARECREEAGFDVVIGPLRRQITHRYPHGLVELHYFDAQPAEPNAEPSPDSGFRWIPAEKLARLPFPEANESILKELGGLAFES